ncbi:uncharacterized protein LOC101850126 [Aplysia californica]|uniref:Uncharacterized protein LOC101850126 n=1 Tax=Aplysia californica TaxID=6500 RepID=A0ABM0ZU78_APLCA|nr:uncharacterized protein LOC101850126 [Aplysia californica]
MSAGSSYKATGELTPVERTDRVSVPPTGAPDHSVSSPPKLDSETSVKSILVQEGTDNVAGDDNSTATSLKAQSEHCDPIESAFYQISDHDVDQGGHSQTGSHELNNCVFGVGETEKDNESEKRIKSHYRSNSLLSEAEEKIGMTNTEMEDEKGRQIIKDSEMSSNRPVSPTLSILKRQNEGLWDTQRGVETMHQGEGETLPPTSGVDVMSSLDKDPDASDTKGSNENLKDVLPQKDITGALIYSRAGTPTTELTEKDGSHNSDNTTETITGQTKSISNPLSLNRRDSVESSYFALFENESAADDIFYQNVRTSVSEVTKDELKGEQTNERVDKTDESSAVLDNAVLTESRNVSSSEDEENSDDSDYETNYNYREEDGKFMSTRENSPIDQRNSEKSHSGKPHVKFGDVIEEIISVTKLDTDDEIEKEALAHMDIVDDDGVNAPLKSLAPDNASPTSSSPRHTGGGSPNHSSRNGTREIKSSSDSAITIPSGEATGTMAADRDGRAWQDSRLDSLAEPEDQKIFRSTNRVNKRRPKKWCDEEDTHSAGEDFREREDDLKDLDIYSDDEADYRLSPNLDSGSDQDFPMKSPKRRAKPSMATYQSVEEMKAIDRLKVGPYSQSISAPNHKPKSPRRRAFHGATKSSSNKVRKSKQGARPKSKTSQEGDKIATKLKSKPQKPEETVAAAVKMKPAKTQRRKAPNSASEKTRLSSEVKKTVSKKTASGYIVKGKLSREDRSDSVENVATESVDDMEPVDTFGDKEEAKPETLLLKKEEGKLTPLKADIKKRSNEKKVSLAPATKADEKQNGKSANKIEGNPHMIQPPSNGSVHHHKNGIFNKNVSTTVTSETPIEDKINVEEPQEKKSRPSLREWFKSKKKDTPSSPKATRKLAAKYKTENTPRTDRSTPRADASKIIITVPDADKANDTESSKGKKEDKKHAKQSPNSTLPATITIVDETSDSVDANKTPETGKMILNKIKRKLNEKRLSTSTNSNVSLPLNGASRSPSPDTLHGSGNSRLAGRVAHKTQSMSSLQVPGPQTSGSPLAPPLEEDTVSLYSKRDSTLDSVSRKSVDYRIRNTTTVILPHTDEKPTKSVVANDETTPYLPLGLAVTCLCLNIVLPGSGTAVSGLSILCCGQPRLSGKTDQLMSTICANLMLGLAQLFTVTFLLVGWFWSIGWGFKLVALSVQHREEMKEQRAKELQALALSAFGSPKRATLFGT